MTIIQAAMKILMSRPNINSISLYDGGRSECDIAVQLQPRRHFGRRHSPSLFEQYRITVVGDLHGQLADLLHIFELNGLPSHRNQYLFNGTNALLQNKRAASCTYIYNTYIYLSLILLIFTFESGDFVDRGSNSVEVVLILFVFLWLYPKAVPNAPHTAITFRSHNPL